MKKFVGSVVCATVCLSWAAGLFAADWPMHNGNNQRPGDLRVI